MKTKLNRIVSTSLIVIVLTGFTVQSASANDALSQHGRSFIGYHVGEGPSLASDTSRTRPTDQTTSGAHSTRQPANIIPSNAALNPLTGMPIAPGQNWTRPLAISISNIVQALPMNGISHADIVIEMLVEGGITRMLALYQDVSNVEAIGSIRSARHYTVSIAESFDAILVSAGGSPQAYAAIEELGVTHIDEVAGRHSEMFRRDENRIRGRTVGGYHSAITTGELVTRWLPDFGIRMTHTHDHLSALFFVNDGTPQDGGNAEHVTVNFASGNTSVFTYNHASGIYTMHQPDGMLIDANDYSQPAFTNLLVLRTFVAPIPGDGSGRLDIATVGSGRGYFACGGRFIPIYWFRPNESFPFVFMRTDGSILTLGRGNTYIGIIPNEMSVAFG